MTSRPDVATVTVLIAVAIDICLLGAAAQTQTGKTLASQVREAQISPDGQAVAFTFEQVPADPLGFAPANVWRVPFAGGASERVTSDDHRASLLRWSPDGRRLAYLSQALVARAPARLMVLPLETGGTARAITDERTIVSSFDWRPDGREIAYLTGGPPTDQSAGRLRIVDVESGRTRDIPTSGDRPVAAFGWATSQAALAVIVQEPRGSARLVILPMSGNVREVASLERPGHDVAWSPDGATIAWLSGTDGSVGSASRVDLVPAGGGSVGPVASLDGLPLFIAWTANRRLSIALRIGRETRVDLLDLATSARTTILPPGIVFVTSAPSWSRDGTRYAVAGSGPDHMPEVFAGTLPPPMPREPDTVGAPPPPVRRITFVSRP